MINRKHRSFICGIKSFKLSKQEIVFLKKYKPWGIILFSRNIRTIKQTQKLTQSIKKVFNNKNYPILIDEEGGRVSRLRNFLDSSIFTAKFFGDLYLKDKNKFNIYLDVYIKQISYLPIKVRSIGGLLGFEKQLKFKGILQKISNFLHYFLLSS